LALTNGVANTTVVTIASGNDQASLVISNYSGSGFPATSLTLASGSSIQDRTICIGYEGGVIGFGANSLTVASGSTTGSNASVEIYGGNSVNSNEQRRKNRRWLPRWLPVEILN